MHVPLQGSRESDGALRARTHRSLSQSRFAANGLFRALPSTPRRTRRLFLVGARCAVGRYPQAFRAAQRGTFRSGVDPCHGAGSGKVAAGRIVRLARFFFGLSAPSVRHGALLPKGNDNRRGELSSPLAASPGIANPFLEGGVCQALRGDAARKQRIRGLEGACRPLRPCTRAGSTHGTPSALPVAGLRRHFLGSPPGHCLAGALLESAPQGSLAQHPPSGHLHRRLRGAFRRRRGAFAFPDAPGLQRFLDERRTGSLASGCGSGKRRQLDPWSGMVASLVVAAPSGRPDPNHPDGNPRGCSRHRGARTSRNRLGCRSSQGGGCRPTTRKD